jgi:hypothetical protein
MPAVWGQVLLLAAPKEGQGLFRGRGHAVKNSIFGTASVDESAAYALNSVPRNEGYLADWLSLIVVFSATMNTL